MVARSFDVGDSLDAGAGGGKDSINSQICRPRLGGKD